MEECRHRCQRFYQRQILPVIFPLMVKDFLLCGVDRHDAFLIKHVPLPYNPDQLAMAP